MNPKILPTVLIVIGLAAGLVYATRGDARRIVYWTAAAILTASVTY